MIDGDLTHKIVLWIGEEADSRSGGTSVPAGVPLHVLQLRLSAEKQGNDPDVTESTELSLRMFNRASTFRILRKLYEQGIIEFVDVRGTPVEVSLHDLSDDPGEGSELSKFCVALTDAGLAYYESLKKKLKREADELAEEAEAEEDE